MNEMTQMKALRLNGETVTKGDKVYDGVKWVTLTGWRMGDTIEVETTDGTREYPKREQLNK